MVQHKLFKVYIRKLFEIKKISDVNKCFNLN